MGARDSERLVGRDAELAKLEAFLAAEPPSARTLVLTGGPGFGKTALWQAGIDSARRRGATALVARPSETEARLGYAALSDLLETVNGAVFSALPTPQRHALEVALLRSEPTDRPPEARAIAAGFLGVLRELGSDEPLVVAVDDVQWLDAASAEALRFAQRRLGREAIAFLLTERTGAGTAWYRTEGSEPMTVAGLDLTTTRLLLAERLDFHPPRMLLRRIFDSTGGNPLFALELARTLLDTDLETSDEHSLAVPNELGTILTQRIAALPETARTAALGSALASDPQTDLIDDLLGADATTAIGELMGAGVVVLEGSRIRFTHPLLASTITAASVPRERRAMHEALARLVDDPVASASHLARASLGPDGEVAATLEQAADLARARGGWETAAALLERSRDLTPAQQVEHRPRRTVAAAEHHVHAGDRSRARALVEELLQETEVRSHRAKALRLLADISAEDQNLAGATAIYRRALQYVDHPLDEVAIQSGLAYVLASSWDDSAVAAAHRALEVVEACGDESRVATPLAVCAMVEFMFGQGADWAKVERALALEDPEAVTPLQARPSTIAALLYAYTGDHAEGRRRLNQVWASASDRGDEGYLPMVLIYLSWLETRGGDFTTAASVAEQAEMLARLTGSQTMLALAIAQQGFVHAHVGDAHRARDASARATALAGQTDFFLPRVWAGATLALLENSLGDAEAAWRAYEDLTAPVEAHGIGEPILVFFLPDALESLIALGQLGRAQPLICCLERRGRELDRPWALATGAHYRGLLLAAKGDLAGAVAALECALAEHERLDMPFERARTLFTKGVVERRAKQRANARASLGEALEEFERLGAQAWSERARDELARVSGKRAVRSGELTPTEKRVVELAAEGLSNKEIADALFVSRHTVESHLSHAYAKLGMRSRSQLARALNGQR